MALFKVFLCAEGEIAGETCGLAILERARSRLIDRLIRDGESAK
jgi:hypothetical protein